MFDKIIRESDSQYIRDTGISVKTVIDLIKSRKSSEEIFAAYPQLDVDDLLWATNQLMFEVEESYSEIAHEMLIHTTSFVGYSKIIRLVMNQNNFDEPQITSILNMIIERAKHLDAFAHDIRDPITDLSN